MRIELVKRPQQSRLFSALSPFIALALTLIAGAIMFSLLGKSPLDALYYYFIDPLRESWSLHELAIKATRTGDFNAAIALSIAGLPTGITATGELTIPAGSSELKVMLQSAADSPATASLVTITGTARIGGLEVRRVAQAQAAGNLAQRTASDNAVTQVLVASTMKPRSDTGLVTNGLAAPGIVTQLAGLLMSDERWKIPPPSQLMVSVLPFRLGTNLGPVGANVITTASNCMPQSMSELAMAS